MFGGLFKSKPKAPDRFHGFYIDESPAGMRGLMLSPEGQESMGRISKMDFEILTKERYWLGFGRFMITHAPQCYIAWNGDTYWCVSLPRVDEKNQFVDGEHGVHVFPFSAKKTVDHLFIPAGDEAIDDLVQTGWSWKLDGEGDGEAFKATPQIAAAAKANVMWTEAWHRELEKKYPPDKHWK